jgi:hypothetical protein
LVDALQVGPKQQLAGAPAHVGGSLGSGAGAAGPLKERKVAEDVVVTVYVKTPLLTNTLHASHGETASAGLFHAHLTRCFPFSFFARPSLQAPCQCRRMGGSCAGTSVRASSLFSLLPSEGFFVNLLQLLLLLLLQLPLLLLQLQHLASLIQSSFCFNISPGSGMLPKEESPILSGSMQCAEAALMSVQTVQVLPS